jgi:hypothetical protein
MNIYERPFAERLHTEAARIPLPPRERWVPAVRRRRPRPTAVLATIGVLALAILVVAPLFDQLRVWNPAGNTPLSPSEASSVACGQTQNQTTPATCVLIPGTLVEIVGHDGHREASTPLVRVKLDNAQLSAGFGDPALFEADARTQIEPRSPNIAATGVKVGAPVQVSFDPRAPKTPSGAYLLTQFVVVSDGRLPDCFVELDINDPPPGPLPGTGAMNAEEAFRRTFPNVTDFKMFPGDSAANSLAPVWIVAANGETYVAYILGATPTNNWYAYTAKFVRCHTPQEVRDRQIVPGSPSDSPRPDGTRG